MGEIRLYNYHFIYIFFIKNFSFTAIIVDVASYNSLLLWRRFTLTKLCVLSSMS